MLGSGHFGPWRPAVARCAQNTSIMAQEMAPKH
jgi:hypothetical protein